MSKPVAVKCFANQLGTKCDNRTTNQNGMCHLHVGATGHSVFAPTRIKDRFPKPVYAPQGEELLDNNSGLITPREMLSKSLKMIADGISTGSTVLAVTGLYTSGPAGSAIFDKWRVEKGVDLGTDKYMRPLTVPLPSVFKPTEGSFLPFEFNREYKEDYKASARRSYDLRNARRVFPTHIVKEVLNDQCEYLHRRIVHSTQSNQLDAADLYMDHMEQVAKLVAQTDPAAAADKEAQRLRSLPMADKAVLKQPFQSVLDMEPPIEIPALDFIIQPFHERFFKPVVLNGILKPIFKIIPLSSTPAVSEEKRTALAEVIRLYEGTARRIRGEDKVSIKLEGPLILKKTGPDGRLIEEIVYPD